MFFSVFYVLLPPPRRSHRVNQMREACIPAANGHFTAKALATLYDNFLGSLGLSGADGDNHRDGRGEGGGTAPARPLLLGRAKVNEMRAYQVSGGSCFATGG